MRIHSESVIGGALVLAAVALLFAEIKVPAVGIDDSESAVRGALGVSLEDLSLSNDLGKLSFLLNGGSALLSGAFACFAVAKCRRKPLSDHDHQDQWRSEDAVV
ncbi:MAG TPA: hypothetical protein VMQ54_05020 [Steroidobacteraceae bacterium]|jgi:hypothetical protein|nr:hypothetical protein [Steroidobacteraceae bacterium]